MRQMLRLSLAATCLLAVGASLAPAASADRAFTSRFAQMARGDVTIAANTIMSCPSSASCTQSRAGTGSSLNNQDFTMSYVDVDSDGTTFDSSSANLTLPAGSTVLFAGLYWGADTSAGGSGLAAPSAAARNTVKLKLAGGSTYSTITASQLDTDAARLTRYQGFADVTSQVSGAGSGTYTVANVQAGTGTDRYGGWALVVAYKDPTLGVNWVSVYDGFGSTGFGGSNSSTDVVLSGFQTPASGTVAANFGMVSYEGELGWTGDSATLNGTNLVDALHPAGNYFNSTITRLGAQVADKSPNYVNQLGFDANVMDVDGLLPSGSTSATVHFASPVDMFMPGVMTLVTDQVATGPAVATTPAVSGTVQDGQTITTSNGTWTGSTPMTYTYQWQRCDSAGSGCTDISGATAATYQLVSGDVGHTFRAVVTATNAVGSANSTSAPTAVATAAPPANGSPPSVSGTALDGQTLSASNGTWTGTPAIAYSYQWQRCTPFCVDIPGATGSTYDLVPADVGSTIRVVATGTNSAGSASAASSQTAVVGANPPVNTVLPAVSGTASDGHTLTGSNGTWAGTPASSYSYQWTRCDSLGANCSDIAGATDATYALTPDDVGSTVRLVVTAANSAASVPAASVQSAVVTGVDPSVSGTALDGQILTADPGSWGGPGATYQYQWRRCDASGDNCVDIPGATGSTYQLTAADLGSTIVVVVTATNGSGSSSRASTPTGVVSDPAPANGDRPTVSGDTAVGSTLTADPGTWTGPGPIAYDYQWLRCDAAGNACQEIAGATDSTYVVAPEDAGHTFRVEVSAGNDGGSTSATSEDTDPVPGAGPGGGGGDIADSIPDSLVSSTKCQRVLAGTGFKRQRVKGVGSIRLEVAAGAYISPKHPLRVTAKAPAGKLRSVAYLLDGRVVSRPRKSPYRLKVSPKLFAHAGKHVLAIRMTPKKARSHKMTLHITTGPCSNVMSGFQWKTATGTGLHLRIDSRKAVQSASFTVPKRMMPMLKDAGKRPIGNVLIYLAGGRKLPFDLKLRKGDRTATLLRAAARVPLIRLTKKGVVVSGLPAKAGILEITLYTRDKTNPNAFLPKRHKAKVSARLVEAGRPVRLTTTIRAQRH